MARITLHHQLTVYKQAMDAAMKVFGISRTFPKEEIYSLTNQIRRCARSAALTLQKHGDGGGMRLRF